MNDLLDMLVSADFAEFMAIIFGIAITGGAVGAMSVLYLERRMRRTRNRQPRYLFK